MAGRYVYECMCGRGCVVPCVGVWWEVGVNWGVGI